MNTLLKLIMLVLLGLHTPAFALDYDDEDSGADDKHVYHVYEDIDLVSTAKVQYGKPKLIMKITYPRLTGETSPDTVDQFNELVSAIIKEEIAAFKQQVQEHQDAQQQTEKSELKNDLTIDFDSSTINMNDKPIMSIRFKVQAFITGMQRPYRRHRVLNYDLAEGRPLELNELFSPESNYLERLSNYAVSILTKRFKNHDISISGASPMPENFKNWSLNPEGLRVTFDEYQIGSARYGTQSVLIPYSELNDIVAPDSTLGSCLSHQRRCLRNRLLTGGFMEEAAVDTQHRRFDPVLRLA